MIVGRDFRLARTAQVNQQADQHQGFGYGSTRHGIRRPSRQGEDTRWAEIRLVEAGPTRSLYVVGGCAICIDPRARFKQRECYLPFPRRYQFVKLPQFRRYLWQIRCGDHARGPIRFPRLRGYVRLCR